MTSTTTAPNLKAALSSEGPPCGLMLSTRRATVKKTERTNLGSVRSGRRGGSSNGTSNAYERFGMTERPAFGWLLDLAAFPVAIGLQTWKATATRPWTRSKRSWVGK